MAKRISLTRILASFALGTAIVLGVTELKNSPKRNTKNTEVVRTLDDLGLTIPNGYNQVQDNKKVDYNSFGIQSEIYDKRPFLKRTWEVQIENRPLESYAPAQGIEDLSSQRTSRTYEDKEGNKVNLKAKKYPEITGSVLRHSPPKGPTFYVLYGDIIFEISGKDFNSTSKFVEGLIENQGVKAIKISAPESRKEPPLSGKIYNTLEKSLD